MMGFQVPNDTLSLSINNQADRRLSLGSQSRPLGYPMFSIIGFETESLNPNSQTPNPKP